MHLGEDVVAEMHIPATERIREDSAGAATARLAAGVTAAMGASICLTTSASGSAAGGDTSLHQQKLHMSYEQPCWWEFGMFILREGKFAMHHRHCGLAAAHI